MFFCECLCVIEMGANGLEFISGGLCKRRELVAGDFKREVERCGEKDWLLACLLRL